MRKILDIFVLTLVGILVYCILVSSTVQGATRRDRTLDNPQVVIRHAQLTHNSSGGHDYIVKGKVVARSSKNKNGTYDVYVKGRLKYKNAKFTHTIPSYTRYNPSTKNYNPNPIVGTTKQIHISNRSQYLKQWTAQREAKNRNPKVWEHFNPQVKFKK